MLRVRQQRLPELDKPCRQPAAPAKRIMPAVNLTPVNLLRVQFGVNRLIHAEDKRFVAPGLKDDAQSACGFFTRFKLPDE